MIYLFVALVNFLKTQRYLDAQAGQSPVLWQCCHKMELLSVAVGDKPAGKLLDHKFRHVMFRFSVGWSQDSLHILLTIIYVIQIFPIDVMLFHAGFNCQNGYLHGRQFSGSHTLASDVDLSTEVSLLEKLLCFALLYENEEINYPEQDTHDVDANIQRVG